jgi:hypothetical protein
MADDRVPTRDSSAAHGSARLLRWPRWPGHAGDYGINERGDSVQRSIHADTDVTASVTARLAETGNRATAPMPRRRLLRLVSGIAVAASTLLGLAACGGEEDDEEDDD